MKVRNNIKKLIAVGLLLAVMNLTACGYVLHPERRGQTGGNLDPAIVLLDAVGLLFFLVPGVVAFAVDIASGTIYLPMGGKLAIDKHMEEGQARPESPSGIDKDLLAAKLSSKLNRPIDPKMIQYYGAAPDVPGGWPMEVTVLN